MDRGDARALGARLSAFDEATRAGDRARVRAELSAMLGLSLPLAEAPGGARVAPLLRYDRVREIDVLGVVRGVRPAAKFEDLSLEAASRLAEALERAGLATLRVGPYSKRLDVTLSYDAQEQASDKYVLLASRGEAAREIAEAEAQRGSIGTRRAGLLLGYPPCCVERFVELTSAREVEDEGINEIVLRRFVDDAERLPSGALGVPWELNPLTSLSPVGFMPCSSRCEAALRFARALLSLLSGSARTTTEAALRRPILFLRYSVFWALAGAKDVRGAALGYREAVLNDAGEPEVQSLRGAALSHLGPSLARGVALSLSCDALRIRGPAGDVALPVLDARIPRLLAFGGGVDDVAV